MNPLEWEKAIEEARSLAEKAKEHQMQIAEIALKVCEISWGGSVKLPSQKEKFTIKRFAKESGLNWRTVSNWIGVRTLVFNKLNHAQQKMAQYTEMVWISRYVNKSTPRREVQKRFDDYFSVDSYERKIVRYMCDLRSLFYNFQKKSAVFKCEQSTLNEILFYTTRIASEIKRERPKSKARLMGVTCRPKASAARGVCGERVKNVEMLA